MSRFVSFGVLVAILIVLGVIFYQVIASFLLPMFLATMLVVIFHPLHRWMLRKTGDRRYVASLLTTMAVLLIVLVPFIGVCTFALIEASSVATHVNVGTMRDRIANTRAQLGLDMPHAEKWRQVESLLTQAMLAPRVAGDAQPVVSPSTIASDFDLLVASLEHDGVDVPDAESGFVRDSLVEAAQHTPGTLEYDSAAQRALGRFRAFKRATLGGTLAASMKELANPSDEQLRDLLRQGMRGGQDYVVSALGNTTAFLAKTLVGLIIMVVAMFFFFLDGPKMIESLMQLAPLDRTYERELLLEFDRVSRAVVTATLLSAVAQGLLAGIGYAVAGLESVFLLTLLTTFFAMVPFVGAASIWVPASLWLYFYEDRPVAAIMLAIYGAAVVSMIDNVIKPWVLHGQSKLHPLAALLSVLGGVQALGPIGILVGPMVFVFLATLLRILQRELTRIDKVPWETTPHAEPG
jgi:predicted PurR-regulated permease PerM